MKIVALYPGFVFMHGFGGKLEGKTRRICTWYGATVDFTGSSSHLPGC